MLDEPGEYVQPGVATNPPLPVDRLPAVELKDAGGAPATLQSDGRPMVVNLWYSSCPPCSRELAAFAEVHGEVGDSVRFVGVNPIDDGPEMTAYAADRGVTYELLRDPGGLLADDLRVTQYPMTVFVAADGSIVDSTGVLDADELRERVAELTA